METFIIDWPVLALLGVIFGARTSPSLWWRSRAFLAGLATTAAFTLVALLSYAVSPDWMWMYFLEPAVVSWAVWLVAPAYLFVYVFGFAATVSLRQWSRRAAWVAAGACVALEVAIITITWDRYHLVGTAEEWARGAAEELFSIRPEGDARTIGMLSPIFLVVLVVALVTTARGRRASAARR